MKSQKTTRRTDASDEPLLGSSAGRANGVGSTVCPGTGEPVGGTSVGVASEMEGSRPGGSLLFDGGGGVHPIESTARIKMMAAKFVHAAAMGSLVSEAGLAGCIWRLRFPVAYLVCHPSEGANTTDGRQTIVRCYYTPASAAYGTGRFPVIAQAITWAVRPRGDKASPSRTTSSRIMPIRRCDKTKTASGSPAILTSCLWRKPGG